MSLLVAAAAVAVLVVLALVLNPAPSEEGFDDELESFASTEDIAKVRALLYHVEWKHRNCEALKKLTKPIALAGSCDIPESTIADAFPDSMTAEARTNAATQTKATCKTFPGGVAKFIEAVNSCA